MLSAHVRDEETLKVARIKKGQAYLATLANRGTEFEKFVESNTPEEQKNSAELAKSIIDAKFKKIVDSKSAYKIEFETLKFETSSSAINEKFQSISDSYINVLTNTKKMNILTKSINKTIRDIKTLNDNCRKLQIEKQTAEAKCDYFKKTQEELWERLLKLKMIKSDRENWQTPK